MLGKVKERWNKLEYWQKGGIIGIILAIFSSFFLCKSLLVPFVLDIKVILLAFSFSIVTGITFGFFPARKAANMNPIDALRHE